MTADSAIDVGREALYLTLMVVTPLLATGLIVGLTVAVLQAVTQVQEQTLAFKVSLETIQPINIGIVLHCQESLSFLQLGLSIPEFFEFLHDLSGLDVADLELAEESHRQ